jgi:hypothetical protein
MNGYMTAIAVFLVAAAVLLHFGKRDAKSQRKAFYERAMAIVLCVAAFAAVVALAPLAGSVFQAVGDGPGMVVLGVVALMSGYLTWRMAFRGKGHHVAGTAAAAIALGLSVALVAGARSSLTSSAGKALSGAGSATSRLFSGQVASGGVTASGSPGNGHAVVTRVHAASPAEGKLALAAAIIILVALVIIFARSHRRTRRGSGGSGGGSRGGSRGGGGTRPLGPGVGVE